MRNYFIWGAGIEGVRAEYNFRNLIEISGFIDNYATGTTGSKSVIIMHPSDVLEDKQNYYIIAVSEGKYFEIKDQLISEGLTEFEDFIYWKLFKKKVVLLYGNCHMAVVRDMLYTSQEFNKKYGIYPLKLIQELKNKIPDSLLEKVDVLISEDIQEDNRFGYEYSVRYLKERIKDDIKLIVIPNLFGMGKAFFYQYDGVRNHPIANDKNGLFSYVDMYIDEQLSKGIAVNDIGDQIKNGTPFSEDEVIRNFNDVIKKYSDREKYCNIKIVDYILDNYITHKLFWDYGHPTNYVINEMVVRLLHEMNLEDKVLCTEDEMNTHEEFVYPCVAKALGLKWKQEKVRCTRNAKKCVSYMDLNEYIEEYAWWNAQKLRSAKTDGECI
jgi:hypothetical protein